MPLEENAKMMLEQGKAFEESAIEQETVTNSTEQELTADEAVNQEVTAESDAENDDGLPSTENETTESSQDVILTRKGCPNDECKSSETPNDVPEKNSYLNLLLEKFEVGICAQKELEAKVIQTLKENANFQIQVRQNMQKELEDSKKRLSGDIFIPLLKEIAELYVEWKEVINDVEEGVAKKKIGGVFEILEEILQEYGCEFGTSEIDSKRRPKYSKLKNKVLTDCKDKHETVAKSHNPWIVKEPFVLYPEYVDVYVFDSSVQNETENKEKIEIDSQEEK